MKLTGYAAIIRDTKPSMLDTTSSTLIYEGYPAGPAFLICKIVLSDTISTRTYAYGAWADRATLTYL